MLVSLGQEKAGLGRRGCGGKGPVDGWVRLAVEAGGLNWRGSRRPEHRKEWE